MFIHVVGLLGYRKEGAKMAFPKEQIFVGENVIFCFG